MWTPHTSDTNIAECR